MDKGKNQHGRRDEHKLHAGAGGGNEDFHSVVRIANILYILKRNTTQEAYPSGSGSQEPEQLLRSGPAVKVFYNKYQN